ncbi:inorganic phosphate transporter, PiT family [Galdieria sulphuraria]|uniref:Phosphate transporter n=1 Tax=Galdieria sulphuraria TaxID=130081 RepID=M2W3X5_GALSU|nr:inorganic phosphate transporter, PiT family [Galdieria sulphuraria]EME30436.1 inorganic phosphate transporter, PiT family [Galdieria sulphuraria]|eukprot:XP_005706956.1 inorganic phosphate transporter, PiT family [Galdieria sulphuraria]
MSNARGPLLFTIHCSFILTKTCIGCTRASRCNSIIGNTFFCNRKKYLGSLSTIAERSRQRLRRRKQLNSKKPRSFHIASAFAISPDVILFSGGFVAFFLSAALGGNDVANAMGTSVGTGAVSIKTALAIGAVMEFAGAVLLGSRVTQTIGSGVISIGPLASLGASSSLNYMLGMFCVLLASTLWLILATLLGLPVSSTHSVVGGLLGFGISAGWKINIAQVLRILSSWFISPIFGGFTAFCMYYALRKLIFKRPSPLSMLKRLLPILIGSILFVLSLFLLMKNEGKQELGKLLTVAMGVSMTSAGLVAALMQNLGILDSSLPMNAEETFTRLEVKGGHGQEGGEVEYIFGLLQFTTACFVAFSHGSNDVSNAIGPFAAIYSLWKSYPLIGIALQFEVPPWILLMGGLGLSVGLVLFGQSVMDTVGRKITHLVPSKGFCVELSTAMTVMLASEFGLPISTTHTLIGCIVAVGLASGNREIDVKVLRSIIMSWFVTVPVTALLSMASFFILKHWLP